LNISEFLEKNCLVQKYFCKKHGVTEQTMCRIKNGENIHLSTAKKIVEITDGQVTYEDLAKNL